MKPSTKKIIKLALNRAGYDHRNRELVAFLERDLEVRIVRFAETELAPAKLRPLFIDFQRRQGLVRPRQARKAPSKAKAAEQGLGTGQLALSEIHEAAK
jgi:hypothetical protein